MTTPLPDRDCLDCTPEEIALAELLASEGRKRIESRMLLGTPLLDSVKIEADYIAEAWAHHDVKVQLHAIHLTFQVLRRWNLNEPR